MKKIILSLVILCMAGAVYASSQPEMSWDDCFKIYTKEKCVDPKVFLEALHNCGGKILAIPFCKAAGCDAIRGELDSAENDEDCYSTWDDLFDSGKEIYGKELSDPKIVKKVITVLFDNCGIDYDP